MQNAKLSCGAALRAELCLEAQLNFAFLILHFAFCILN